MPLPNELSFTVRDPQKRVQKIKSIIFVSLILIVAIIFLPQQIFKASVITVIGEGQISATPAKFSLVVARANTSTDVNLAVDSGEAGVNTLVNVVKNIGGSDAEIQKAFYSVSPLASQQLVNGQSSIVKNYQVANAFKAVITQPEKASELVKELYKNGATSVSNISFISANQEKSQQEARTLAIKDAKSKAQNIAKSAGKRLGRLVSIVDDQADASSSLSTTQNQATTDLSTPTKIDVIKRVSVVYEIW